MMMAVFMTYKSKANIVTNDLYETFLNVGAISNIIKVLLNRNEVQVVVVLKKIKKNEKKIRQTIFPLKIQLQNSNKIAFFGL